MTDAQPEAEADREHSVIDGVLRHVSPSQIKTFRRCARKWYYTKVLRLPDDGTPATDLGKVLHKQLEDYYLEGVPPTYESILKLLELNVPRPGLGILIEFPRDYNTGLELYGVHVKGRIDLTDSRDPDAVAVWDWKSTSRFSYNRTPEELAKDVQGIIYGKWAAQRYRPQTVVFHHGYIRTGKSPGARIVSSPPMTLEHIQDQWWLLDQTVREMVHTAAIKDVESVPANDEACGDFRGCPYADTCSVGRSMFPVECDVQDESTTLDVIARLRAARATSLATTNTDPTRP